MEQAYCNIHFFLEGSLMKEKKEYGSLSSRPFLFGKVIHMRRWKGGGIIKSRWNFICICSGRFTRWGLSHLLHKFNYLVNRPGPYTETRNRVGRVIITRTRRWRNLLPPTPTTPTKLFIHFFSLDEIRTPAHLLFSNETLGLTHTSNKTPPQPIANLSIRIMWFEILGPLSDCFHPRDKLYWVNGLAYKTLDPCAVFTP